LASINTQPRAKLHADTGNKTAVQHKQVPLVSVKIVTVKNIHTFIRY
jgi:hypothetical protein